VVFVTAVRMVFEASYIERQATAAVEVGFVSARST
jgi:hypothetical protein